MNPNNAPLPDLIELLHEAVPDIEIDPAKDASRPFGALGIDSLDKMTLLLSVQEKWNLTFTESEVSELKTLDDVCQIIRRNTDTPCQN